MGGQALAPGDFFGGGGVRRGEDRRRRQPHQRAIAGLVYVVRAFAGDLAISPVIGERVASGRPDVETAALDAVLALFPPSHETIEKLTLVEAFVGDQRVRQAQRHTGVVGPFAGLKAKWAAADDVDHGRMGVAPRKLQRGPKSIADRQAEKRADGAIFDDLVNQIRRAFFSHIDPRSRRCLKTSHLLAPFEDHLAGVVAICLPFSS